MTAWTPKVAWFTPFHKKSSIGQFSQGVTQQLATQAQVDLWVAETDDLLDTSLRVVPYARLSHYADWLREYDYAVYNFGNQIEDRRHIYEACQRHKGIVILHDFVEHDAIVGATGVIVHSDLLRDRVRAVTCAPVRTIHLARAAGRTAPTRNWTDRDVPKDRLLIVSLGDLNRNGHVETALRAIAAGADLKNRTYYMVLGSFDTPHGQQLVELSRELGLQDVVHFAGPGEDLLQAAGKDADICDESLRGALGDAVFASQQFSPGEYATQFLHFCQELAVYEPAFRLAELVAAELKAIGVTPDMPIVDTVARQAAALLDGEWDPPILRKRGS